MLSRPTRVRIADRPPVPPARATWWVRAGSAARSAAGSTGALRLAAAVGGLAWLLRARTAGHFRTWDEPNWMLRSVRFSTAVATGRFDHASATPGWGVATMPGITTMTIGSVAHAIWWVGRAAGLWATAPGDRFELSGSGLLLAHLGAATVNAALIALLVVLLARWVGPAAAGIAGVLVATEPLLVAHGALIHTDELMTLFGVTSMVALALALGVPARSAAADPVTAPDRSSRRLGVLAGLLFAGSLLTKISAVMFLPGMALLAVWAVAVARRQRGGGIRSAAGGVRPAVTGWLAGAGGLSIVAYPAVWLMLPGAEIGRLTMSLGLGVYPTHVLQLFRGTPTTTPGPSFYVVDLPWRVTPWFLVGGVLAAVAIWCRRAWRPYAGALACLGGPPLAVLSLANKQFDRYGLPLLVLAAIGIGIVAAPLLPALARRAWPGRPARATAALAVALTAAVGGYSLSVAPWGMAYFNPLLGGGPVGVRTVPLGWGEGLEQAGRFIAEREAGRCDAVSVYSTWPIQPDFPCGVWLTEDAAPTATYVVIYVADRMTLPPARLAELVGTRTLLRSTVIRGITYTQVYGPAEHPAERPAGPGGG